MVYPIQVASKRSGVSAHVIRMWERRYGALAPVRTESNRRMYDEESIERLSLLRELIDRGHRIGSLVELKMEELKALAAEEAGWSEKGLTGGAVPAADLGGESEFAVDALDTLETVDDFVLACLSAARDFDAERLRRLLYRARLQFGQRGLLRRVLPPLIQEVGQSWVEGELRSGHEHLITSVVRELLMAPVPGAMVMPTAPELIVGTTSGEVHELGALLAAASARDVGWRVTFLGVNLPAEELAACARSRSARAVAVSVVYPLGCEVARAQLRELRRLLPASVALMVGGRAAWSHQEALAGEAILWVRDLADLEVKLDELHGPVGP